jgi:putative sterol carrier protein
VNFYAAMGTLYAYSKLDEKARELAAKQDISLRFKVKGGPDGVLVFEGGQIKAIPYQKGVKTDIVLYCSDVNKFNDLVDGKGQSVIPLKGFTKLGFLLNKESAFNKLTEDMATLMRKKEFDNKDEMRLSTLLAFYAMVSAIAQIGNEDDLGKVSAKKIPEGLISIEIPDQCYLTIKVTKEPQTKLEVIDERCPNPRSKMVFDSLETAKGVIDGKLDAMSCIATGKIAMSGFIPMLQFLNNILNLVPKYLS